MRFLPILMVAGLLMSCSHQPVSQERKISKEEELAPERAPQQVRDDDDNESHVKVLSQSELLKQEQELENQFQDLDDNSILMAQKLASWKYEDMLDARCRIYFTGSDYKKVIETKEENLINKKRDYKVIYVGRALEGEAIRNKVLNLPDMPPTKDFARKELGSKRSNLDPDTKHHKLPEVTYARNTALGSTGKTDYQKVEVSKTKSNTIRNFFIQNERVTWAINKPETKDLVKLLDEECR